MLQTIFSNRVAVIGSALPDVNTLSFRQANSLLHILLSYSIDLCEQFNMEPDLVKFLRTRPALITDEK